MNSKGRAKLLNQFDDKSVRGHFRKMHSIYNTLMTVVSQPSARGKIHESGRPLSHEAEMMNKISRWACIAGCVGSAAMIDPQARATWAVIAVIV